MFKYFPHTESDIQKMLDTIGVKEIDELFLDIPRALLQDRWPDLENSLSEIELRQRMEKIAAKNKRLICFAGAGTYDHYVPSIIAPLVSRQEFLTSYTPYQPEIAQGTLTYIFEYQSYMTSLTGMDVSNASMYDGATATAEACLMAVQDKRVPRILLAETLDPAVREVVQTYAKYRNIDISIVPMNDGITDRNALQEMVQQPFSAFVTQTPNFFGIVEDHSEYEQLIHANQGLLIMNVDPSTLAVLKSPGEWNADIACGDAQSLGIPMHFGGPHLGFLCAKEKLLRKMPGRIAGMSKDVDGKRAYVLTLQAREQHIRRDKANSNICSNQSLMALWVTIYLSIMGKRGLQQVQESSMKNAHYLYEQLIASGHFKPVFSNPFLFEFVLQTDLDIKDLQKGWMEAGFQGPVSLSGFDPRWLLFCATEQRTKAEIDAFVKAVEVAK